MPGDIADIAPAAVSPSRADSPPHAGSPSRADLPPLEARRRDLDELTSRDWDLLVVGGGITGCGVLLDAASRGLRAALVEADDIAAGTSSRSSRLIHGGLRYLEQFQFSLVREALRERSLLLKLAPHLVRLEPFLFPVYGGPWARPFFGAGLTLYDLLGASADGGFHRHLGVADTLRRAPVLRRSGLRGSFIYHDAHEDDARFAVAVVRTARARGGVAVTRARALRGLEEGGKLTGCVVRDELDGSELTVRASSIVDATGVWTGRADAPFPAEGKPLTLWSRGTHIVVPRDRIPADCGMTLRIPHRVCFLVPDGDRWVIGTTDHEDRGAADRPVPTLAEIDEIVDNVNRSLDVGLTRRDIVSAFAGIRPLAADPGGSRGSTVKVSREHRIRIEPNGLVRISGGKYTTYRLMAAQTVDAAIGARAGACPSVTASLPIAGAATPDGLDAAARHVAAAGVDAERARGLVARYGEDAPRVAAVGAGLGLLAPLGDTQHIQAEVVWTAREESALSLDDFLSRRTRLALERTDRAASIAPRVAELLGAELGWTPPERDAAVAAFLASAHREYDVPSEG